MNETIAKTTPTSEKTTVVYQFKETDSLIRVCRFLSHRGYRDESRAFFESLEKGDVRYFLEIRESTPTPLKKTRYLKENLFIEEFGEKLESEESVFYLHERAFPICLDNAVQTLAALA
jgi:hypothetical protein